MKGERINKEVELICIGFFVSTQREFRMVSLSENDTWAKSNGRVLINENKWERIRKRILQREVIE